jgi:hypothetical protein
MVILNRINLVTTAGGILRKGEISTKTQHAIPARRRARKQNLRLCEKTGDVEKMSLTETRERRLFDDDALEGADRLGE